MVLNADIQSSCLPVLGGEVVDPVNGVVDTKTRENMIK